MNRFEKTKLLCSVKRHPTASQPNFSLLSANTGIGGERRCFGRILCRHRCDHPNQPSPAVSGIGSRLPPAADSSHTGLPYRAKITALALNFIVLFPETRHRIG